MTGCPSGCFWLYLEAPAMVTGQCRLFFSQLVVTCHSHNGGNGCYLVLCHAVSCFCHDVPCCAMLCHAVPCCAMLCHAVPCCAMLCHTALCLALMASSMLQAFKGEYKWILYGDDDTFFFVDGVLELLQDFDPSLPYFITGMSSARPVCFKPQ